MAVSPPTTDVGFLGNAEAKEAWRAREGRGLFRQTRVDPGGSRDQLLTTVRKAGHVAHRHVPWGASIALQDPEWYHENMRQLRAREPQGTSITHEQLVKIPRSRRHFIVRPGLREKAEANLQAMIEWRDDPTRDLCREQHLRIQTRALRGQVPTEGLPPIQMHSAPQLRQLRQRTRLGGGAPAAAAAIEDFERTHPRARHDEPRRQRQPSRQRVLHVAEQAAPADLVASGALVPHATPAPPLSFEVDLRMHTTLDISEPAWLRLRGSVDRDDSLPSSVAG